MPTDLAGLWVAFAEQLGFATSARPIVVFIDALDQLSGERRAHGLGWLPTELPPHVHIVVSTIPGTSLAALERRLPERNRQELRAMSEAEGCRLLDQWLSQENRTLTAEQHDKVISSFARTGSPLYLRLVLGEALAWRSSDRVPRLPASTEGLIRALLGRLSRPAEHGRVLVSRSLGYIAAARHGLAQDELLDVLEADTDVRRDVESRFPSSPRSRVFPRVLWSRLYLDLESFLTESAADGIVTVDFFHRQVRDVAEAMFLSSEDRCERSGALADYFARQPLRHGTSDGTEIANHRKLSELPYQLTSAGRYRALESILLEFRFLEAKLAAQGPYALTEDFDRTLAGDAGVAMEKAIDDLRHLLALRDALRLSSETLASYPEQLTTQLFGRLTHDANPRISALLLHAAQLTEHAWLRPMTASLAPRRLARILTGHKATVTDLLFTPDAGRAVTASADGTCRIWDLESGRTLHTLDAGGGAVEVLALTRDGQRVFAGREDGVCDVWDLEGGVQLASLPGHGASVRALCVHPDGRRVISASADRTLRVWDLDRYTCVRHLRGHASEVWSVAVTSDGKHLVSADGPVVKREELDNRVIRTESRSVGNEALRVWSCRSGSLMSTLVGNTGPIEAVWLDASGRRAITLSREGLHIWKLDGEGPPEALVHGVRAADVCADGGVAVVLSQLGVVTLWDLAQRREIGKLEKDPGSRWSSAHEPGALKGCVSMAGHGSRVVTSTLEALRVWVVPERRLESTLKEGISFTVEKVKISDDGSACLTSSNNYSVRLWHLARQLLAGDSAPVRHKGFVTKLAVTTDGELAVSGANEYDLLVWDLASGTLLRRLEGHGNTVTAIAVVAGTHYIVSGSYDGTIRKWDLDGGREIGRVAYHTQDVGSDKPRRHADLATRQRIERQQRVLSLVINRTGTHALSRQRDDLVLWDLESGAEVARIETGEAISRPLAVSVEGDSFVLSNGPDAIEVWMARPVQRSLVIECCAAVVPAEASHAFGRTAEGALARWDLRTGQHEVIEPAGDSAPGPYTMTPDGNSIAQCVGSDLVSVWDLTTGKRAQVEAKSASSLHLSPDGRHVAWRMGDATCAAWTVDERDTPATFQADYPLKALSVAPGGRVLVGCEDGSVHILVLTR